MNVLYFIDSLEIGGAESSICNMIRDMHARFSDINVQVVTLHEIGRLGTQLQEEGFKISCLNATLGRASSYLSASIHLAKFIKSQNFDIVHVHLFPASYVAAIASCIATKPAWYFTEHNVWNRRRESKFFHVLDKLVYGRFVKFTAVSHSVANALTEWLPFLHEQLLVIPNGVSVPEIDNAVQQRSANNGEVVLLFAGRLVPAKGCDLLLKALAAIRQLPFRLLIAGDGEERQRLEELAGSLLLSEKIEFLGMRRDLPQIMRSADIFVAPSRWEGLPMVILEAMAAGLPVVATTVGGVPEIVEHGTTGFLLPPEDIDQLQKQLTQVVLSPERLNVMGQNSRAKILSEYSIQFVTEQLIGLYTGTGLQTSKYPELSH